MLTYLFTHYASYEYALASTQLFLAMLGMGALLSVQDFSLEIRNPRALCAGLAIQWLLVPVVAIVVGHWMPVPVGIALGLLLVAAVPGGTLTNILTWLGRGNVPLSISLTAISTVAALVVTPVLLKWTMADRMPEGFEMPTARVARDILLTLMIPLAAGMVIRSRLSPAQSERFAHVVVRTSLLLIVLMAIGAGGSGRLDPKAYGTMGIATLVVMAFLLQGTAWGVSRLLSLNSKDTLAIVVEVTFRNMSLALAIKALLFPARQGILDPVGDAVFFTVLLYGGISLFMTVLPVMVHRLYSKQA